ncbi:auxin-responsive protein SAUR71-like [Gossypium australe]|uniref:Auxin-responsive protein SAUR71-like n=1 Tax=Gossypium australe TaxID=47621 RepID=A0A5B6UF01_9ROSI|nr:auxin-responsive protein SAUR71-like [Gossypium australe]
MAESRRGLMMFRPFFKKLRKGFSSSAYSASPALNHSKFNEDMSIGKAVPSDVKEGFFTVFSVKGKETQSLMDQAREEYGFQQKGALSLPCRPLELQEILQHSKGSNNACTESWGYM